MRLFYREDLLLMLVQWKQTRRVDHLNILGFHPRYRDAARALGASAMAEFAALGRAAYRDPKTASNSDRTN